MIGCRMPNSSVIAVFTSFSCFSDQWTNLKEAAAHMPPLMHTVTTA